jgi:hypothetical protein
MKLKDLKVGDIVMFEVNDEYTNGKLTIIVYLKDIIKTKYAFQDLWVSDNAVLDDDWEINQNGLDNDEMTLIKILDHIEPPADYIRRKMPELFV